MSNFEDSKQSGTSDPTIDNKWDKPTVDEIARILREQLAEAGGLFAETLPIREDGSLELNLSESKVASYFASMVSEGHADDVENLYELAQKVAEQHPELEFVFDKDPEGQWIKWGVRERADV